VSAENTFGFIDNTTAMAKAKIHAASRTSTDEEAVGILKDLSLQSTYRLANMTPGQLFDEIRTSRTHNPEKDNRYFYWYGKIDQSEQLVLDVQPNEWIWVDSDDKHDFGLYMWFR
jgi:hypothetical protein